MLSVNELITYIFEDKTHFLSRWLETRLKESRRFRLFVEQYRDKIRSKHRQAGNLERLKDLWLELDAAALLTGDRRIEVRYETYAAHGTRGPDFTCTFRVNTKFNLEVTRLRLADTDSLEDVTAARKLLYCIMEKVGQIPPSTINVLYISAETPPTPDDLTQAVMGLQYLAERKEDDFFARRGYKDAVELLRHFLRLSGVMLRIEPLHLWLNPQAKHLISPELATALRKLSAPENPL